MQAKLAQLGWPYETMHDPLNPEHPLLVLHRRVWCWFEGEAAAPVLQKITLATPALDPHGYERLVPVAG